MWFCKTFLLKKKKRPKEFVDFGVNYRHQQCWSSYWLWVKTLCVQCVKHKARGPTAPRHVFPCGPARNWKGMILFGKKVKHMYWPSLTFPTMQCQLCYQAQIHCQKYKSPKMSSERKKVVYNKKLSIYRARRKHVCPFLCKYVFVNTCHFLSVEQVTNLLPLI